MERVLDFSGIRKEDVASAGGKGANLGEMTGAGLKVPEGFVVTAETYREFAKENQIDAEKMPAEIRKDIRKGVFNTEAEAEIRAKYEALGENARVAVRSSATAEDLEDASFAGQQETYLNVRGADGAIEKIRDCYASLWGDRAVAYRKEHGYDSGDVAIAVVVQRMIESEKAGVLFTVNPVNNNADEMMLSASYGLGEAVVSGRVNADNIVCDRDGKVLNETLGSKEIRIVYDESRGEGGTRVEDVPEKERKVRCLSDAEIREICEAGKNIEAHYGHPMDIEWGIQDGQVYILQARAITTIAKEKPDEKLIAEYVANNKIYGLQQTNMSFLIEKLPEAPLPLDSDCLDAINGQKGVILKEAGIIASSQPPIDDDGITVLPPSTKKITGGIVRLPGLIRQFADLEGCAETLKKEVPAYRAELEEIQNLKISEMTAAECGETIAKIDDYVKRLAHLRFRYALFSGVLAERKMTKIVRKADSGANVFDLYGNLEYKTAMVNRSMDEIAEKIKSDPAALEDALNGKSYAELHEKYPAVRESMDAFMREHGFKEDYNCYGVKARSFLEDPDRLMRVIRPMLKTENTKNDEKYDSLMAKIRETYHGKKLEKVLKDIEAIRYFHVIREESQYMWETAYYYTRRTLERASEVMLGKAEIESDLVYLRLSELREACARGELNDSDREKIARRKEKRPLALEVWERSKAQVFESKSRGDTLKGVSGSPGEAAGPARVIRGPEEFDKMRQGDVLVCPYTDPEWTPLFPLAAAVVADSGAALSHAAIVAREYGIPCVLGVGHATEEYKDDEKVMVDGTKGEVRRIG